MKNTNDTQDNMRILKQEGSEQLEETTVTMEAEGDSYIEQLLRAIIASYSDAFNRANGKTELQFTMTLTNHKIATEDGNKDVAYLRIDRHVKSKSGANDHSVPELVHQETYFFKSMAERLNPGAPWKEQLFVNALARLVGAGLEYAEFLRRAKKIQDNQARIAAPKSETEQKMDKLGLLPASELPAPVDEEYKKWLKEARAKEGL